MLSSIALEKVKDEAHKARINSGTFSAQPRRSSDVSPSTAPCAQLLATSSAFFGGRFYVIKRKSVSQSSEIAHRRASPSHLELESVHV
jgi:hypothetical protein